MISPPNSRARAIASEDLPLAVGPATTSSGDWVAVAGGVSLAAAFIAHPGLLQEKREVAQRGDGQDESENDEQTTDIGGFRLAIQKWHRGHSTRNGRRE